MNELGARTADFFDRYIVGLIVEKYGLDDREALRAFITSETYQMLLDKETGLYTMSPYVLFDMWECEKITGDPRNSEYIRGE